MPESITQRLYRALTEAGLDAGFWIGSFFVFVGILLIVQLQYSSTRGFVYGYGSTRIYRAESPRGYRVRFVLQALVTGLLIVGGLLFAQLM